MKLRNDLVLTCQKLGQGRWLAQGVRVPAAKPDDASTIPGSTGRRAGSHRLSASLHISNHGMHVPIHSHADSNLD